MPELNYLRNDRKWPGSRDYITHVDFKLDHGRAGMELYDIFPGVQLMVSEFFAESCFRTGEKENAIGIHHCLRGRFECAFDSRSFIYMGEGDISINSQMHPPISSSFPLNYFYGSTIILYPEQTKGVPWLEAFGISTEAITEKFSLNSRCPVFRRNEAVEHVYGELYACLSDPELPFLRLKILELLYHVQSRQTVLEENKEHLPGNVVSRIKHVREHLIENPERRIGLRELAKEHGLSLTQLKDGFRQIYGQSPYAYLRDYKMHLAAQLLRDTDRKVSEIAAELGYQNPSKFSEAFQAVIGQNPRAYRK